MTARWAAVIRGKQSLPGGGDIERGGVGETVPTSTRWARAAKLAGVTLATASFAQYQG